MSRHNSHQYTGKLNDPLPVSADDLSEIHERLMLLFDDCGVARPGQVQSSNEDTSWRDLAFALAVRHVPGLRSVKPSGRSKKWGEWQLVRLHLDVILQTREHHNNISRACYFLAGREPWKSFVQPETDQKSRGRTLRRKFYAVKKQNHRIVGIVERTIRDFPDDANDRLRLAKERIQV